MEASPARRRTGREERREQTDRREGEHQDAPATAPGALAQPPAGEFRAGGETGHEGSEQQAEVLEEHPVADLVAEDERPFEHHPHQAGRRGEQRAAHALPAPREQRTPTPSRSRLASASGASAPSPGSSTHESPGTKRASQSTSVYW